MTLVGGVPLMVGGELTAGRLTVMENAGRDALAAPSETAMTMLPQVPASPLAGVPDSLPVAASKLAHAGPFWIENVSVSPSASLADGRKSYGSPASTPVAGVPEICGGLFDPAGSTVIVNAGRLAVSVPSVTLITMPP